MRSPAKRLRSFSPCPQVLIEKDWISFGHKFADRWGVDVAKDGSFFFFFLWLLLSGLRSCNTAVIWIQVRSVGWRPEGGVAHFLPVPGMCVAADGTIPAGKTGVYKNSIAAPAPAPSWPRSLPRQAFEFSEWFLLQIHEHVHSCQYGNFLGNNQRQREELQWVSAAKSSLVLALQLIIGQLVQKVVAQHKDWSKCKGLAMTEQKHLRTQQKGALWL